MNTNRSRFRLCLVGRLCLPLLGAMAGPRTVMAAPPAGAPPQLDDSTVNVLIKNDPGRKDNELKYGFVIEGSMVNPVRYEDAVKVEWRQGGKVVHAVDTMAERGERRHFSCASEKEDLKTLGSVQVALSYISDATDKSTPLRTLKFDVVDVKEPYIKNTTRPYAQVAMSSQFGGAVAALDSGEMQRLQFEFWRSIAPGTGERLKDEDMRCSVDGNRVPGKFEYSLNKLGATASSFQVKTATGQTSVDVVHFTLQMIKVGRISFANKERAKTFAGEAAAWVQLNKYPGQWVCQFRSAGEIVREFRFRVKPDGSLEPHAEQVGPNALALSRGTVLLDIGFPSGGKFDYAPLFSPQAMKNEAFFGRPWSKPRLGEPLRGAAFRPKRTVEYDVSAKATCARAVTRSKGDAAFFPFGGYLSAGTCPRGAGVTVHVLGGHPFWSLRTTT
jgi:hypothetical protein